MTSSEKSPKTYFSENREGHCYSVGTATRATRSWNKHKDTKTGMLTSKKKQGCVDKHWTSACCRYSRVYYSGRAKGLNKSILIKVKQTAHVTEFGSISRTWTGT